jgi:hypothetical protein
MRGWDDRQSGSTGHHISRYNESRFPRTLWESHGKQRKNFGPRKILLHINNRNLDISGKQASGLSSSWRWTWPSLKELNDCKERNTWNNMFRIIIAIMQSVLDLMMFVYWAQRDYVRLKVRLRRKPKQSIFNPQVLLKIWYGLCTINWC